MISLNARDAFDKDVARLKLWLGLGLINALALCFIGVYTYLNRNTIAPNGLALHIAESLPGPFRMLSYIRAHDSTLIGSAVINVVCSIFIGYSAILLLIAYSALRIFRFGWKSHNVFSYALIFLCILCSLLPVLAPLQADSRSERLNTMAFGDLFGGYLANPLVLSLSFWLLVFVLWLRGELRS